VGGRDFGFEDIHVGSGNYVGGAVVGEHDAFVKLVEVWRKGE